MATSPTLTGLPPEVLERIALCAGAADAPGPPMSVRALQLSARPLHAALAPAHNAPLYARLFEATFDGDAPVRRLAPFAPTAAALRDEFVRRFAALARFRTQADTWAADVGAGVDAWAANVDTDADADADADTDADADADTDTDTDTGEGTEDGRAGIANGKVRNVHREATIAHRDAVVAAGSVRPQSSAPYAQLDADLWTLYVMLLEDSGRNARAARELGHAHAWLRTFWLRGLRPPVSATEAESTAGRPTSRPWAPDSARNALAMWCFWFLLKPDEFSAYDDILTVLRVFSHSGHKYPLTSPHWATFDPPLPALDDTSFPPNDTAAYLRGYLGHPTLALSPPPLAAAAGLCFIALTNHPHGRSHLAGPGFRLPLLIPADPLPPALPCAAPRMARGAREWDGDWARAIALGAARLGRELPMPDTRAVKPGGLAGVWEGMFMYTEFNVYGLLLTGALPNFLERAGLAQHRQTWRLREHHMLAGGGAPLPAGNALDAALPAGASFAEDGGVLRVFDPRADAAHTYYTWDPETRGRPAAPADLADAPVVDIIVTGEGHSAWGGFTLRGRVRALDGFLLVQKRYADAGDGDRGEWLYRGLLVGARHGNIAGRWRECMTPALEPGYEGCFLLSRRGFQTAQDMVIPSPP